MELDPAASGQLTAIAHRADDTLEPGTMLGEFRIEHVIGRGGMGCVYSAIHPVIGKKAAIKILRDDLCADPIAVDRFIDEARVVNQIGHPNIVDIFSFGQTAAGDAYLAMEFLHGETLRARAERKPLSLDETIHVIATLAQTLEAIHEKGVVHRDLKPENVFLVEVRGKRPLIKLLDFGIAKLLSAKRLRTLTGEVLGTPQYLAPEQAAGDSIDHRADIYALGGIAFELLTNEPPFRATATLAVLAAHMEERPRAPTEVTANIPAELDSLVVRMLAKAPAERPTLAEIITTLEDYNLRQSVRALREATLPPLIREPTAIEPPVVPHPTQRRLDQRRAPWRWFALGGAAIVAVVVAIAVAASGGDPEPVASPSSPPPAPVATPIEEPKLETAAAPEPVKVEPEPVKVEPEPAPEPVAEPAAKTVKTPSRTRVTTRRTTTKVEPEVKPKLEPKPEPEVVDDLVEPGTVKRKKRP